MQDNGIVGVYNLIIFEVILPHCGGVTQICIFTLQLCKTDEADLRLYITTVQDG